MALKSTISKEDLIFVYQHKEECPLIEYDDVSVKITNDMYIPYLKVFSAILAEGNVH